MGKDKSLKDEQSTLEVVESPFKKALILVCEKCGKKAGSKDENFSSRLQKELKRSANNRFGKHQVRTVVTSCFDICPKNRVVACILPQSGDGNRSAQFVELRIDSLKKAETAILNCVEQMGDGLA